MSVEEAATTKSPEPTDAPMDAAPADAAPSGPGERRRPRLNLAAALGGGERKRGKSMFGLVLGTLNKAKDEDKARSASDAARKRQEIDARLQKKLRRETESVRRAEEAKKERVGASRKEEELQLKDSIAKLKRARRPLLANFLSTADDIPGAGRAPAVFPPRAAPAPIFYLPAVLLPSQQEFLDKRKEEEATAAEVEWSAWKEERAQGVQEIATLRAKVAEYEESVKSAKKAAEDEAMAEGDEKKAPQDEDAQMDVDDGAKEPAKEETKADDRTRSMRSNTEEGFAVWAVFVVRVYCLLASLSCCEACSRWRRTFPPFFKHVSLNMPSWHCLGPSLAMNKV
ncbi:unnamed protein product [Peniophora sp. CBMAI 1063]|nr:unnamed protein product [Peniophora sp. CBMAI 1063]